MINYNDFIYNISAVLFILLIILLNVDIYWESLKFSTSFYWGCAGDTNWGIPRDKITIDCFIKCNQYNLTTICFYDNYDNRYKNNFTLMPDDCICVNKINRDEVFILTRSGLIK